MTTENKTGFEKECLESTAEKNGFEKINRKDLEDVNGGTIWDTFVCGVSGGHHWVLTGTEIRNGKTYKLWKCSKCQAQKQVYE